MKQGRVVASELISPKVGDRVYHTGTRIDTFIETITDTRIFTNDRRAAQSAVEPKSLYIWAVKDENDKLYPIQNIIQFDAWNFVGFDVYFDVNDSDGRELAKVDRLVQPNVLETLRDVNLLLSTELQHMRDEPWAKRVKLLCELKWRGVKIEVSPSDFTATF